MGWAKENDPEGTIKFICQVKGIKCVWVFVKEKNSNFNHFANLYSCCNTAWDIEGQILQILFVCLFPLDFSDENNHL